MMKEQSFALVDHKNGVFGLISGRKDRVPILVELARFTAKRPVYTSATLLRRAVDVPWVGEANWQALLGSHQIGGCTVTPGLFTSSGAQVLCHASGAQASLLAVMSTADDAAELVTILSTANIVYLGNPPTQKG